MTIHLTTRTGDELTAQTPPLHPALPVLQPISPKPDATMTNPWPRFHWSGAKGAVSLEVVGEGVDNGAIWKTEAKGPEVTFNQEGTAKPATLEPASRYTWTARATVPDPKDTSVTYTQFTRSRFQIAGPEPPQPKVSGTLIWGNYYTTGCPDSSADMAILYAPSDSPLDAFVGPVGIGYPCLSPDGRLLLYASDEGLWLDHLDGAPPTRLAAGFCRDPRWSPDMKQIAYAISSKGRNRSGKELEMDVWVCDADGSHQHPASATVGALERYPAWSPDGKWIAFRKVANPVGDCLWLVRPDGTEAHPVIATTFKGYPQYKDSFLSEHDWSRDGESLLTVFAANVGDDISGLGLLPAAGGELVPLFVVRSGLPWDPMPHGPRWSPDGKQIIFAAECQTCETDSPHPHQVESWIINADGHGAPQRLTWDYAKPNGFSWCGVKIDPARLKRCGRTGARKTVFGIVTD